MVKVMIFELRIIQEESQPVRTGPNIRKRADGRYEARYIKSRTDDGKIRYGYVYAPSYEEVKEKRNTILGLENIVKPVLRRMQILILGHGDHGATVADLCGELRIFEKISFLDDNKQADNIIGKCGDYISFVNEYPIAYPGFGNNELRKQWFEKLQSAGFIVPTLVHPTALIAPSAKIGEGTIVEARATVNSGVVIGKGCIISTNTTVDVSVSVGNYTHTAPGITIPKRTVIGDMINVNTRMDEYSKQ